MSRDRPGAGRLESAVQARARRPVAARRTGRADPRPATSTARTRSCWPTGAGCPASAPCCGTPTASRRPCSASTSTAPRSSRPRRVLAEFAAPDRDPAGVTVRAGLDRARPADRRRRTSATYGRPVERLTRADRLAVLPSWTRRASSPSAGQRPGRRPRAAGSPGPASTHCSPNSRKERRRDPTARLPARDATSPAGSSPPATT